MDKDGELGRGVERVGRVGRGLNTSGGRTESTPNPPTKKARQRGFVAIFTNHPSAIPNLLPSLLKGFEGPSLLELARICKF